MPHAMFTVAVDAVDTPARDGQDEVAFLFSAHDGSEPRPLQRGASGGELSRVMLALEVCLVGTQPVPTMVFDEVDAGVGGKAAVEIGRRLARLATATQVIVVTHLPQVAAFADQHYVVVKSERRQRDHERGDGPRRRRQPQRAVPHAGRSGGLRRRARARRRAARAGRLTET